jgi:general secretion pathway protein C
MNKPIIKGLKIFNLFICLLILFASAIIVRDILNLSVKEEKTFTLKDLKEGTNEFRKKRDIFHYASILEKNPFGEPQRLIPLSKKIERKEKSLSLPSDLTLIGTVIGPPDYAIIRNESESKEEIFKKGENVFDRGILIEIKASSVRIRQGGSEYTLSIPFEEAETTKNRTRKKLKSKSSLFARKLSEREYVIDSRKVEESLSNPKHLLTDARLLPNIKNGKQEGFIITEVVPNGLYHSLGLRNGDILLRINGLEISSPEVAIKAMTALRGMNRVDLDIIRNGKNMTLSYEIR